MRCEEEIKAMAERLSKIAWWNRHKLLEEEGILEDCEPSIRKEAIEKAKEIEKEIPLEELTMSDEDWSITLGKYSAINWVLGSPWEGSMDEGSLKASINLRMIHQHK